MNIILRTQILDVIDDHPPFPALPIISIDVGRIKNSIFVKLGRSGLCHPGKMATKVYSPSRLQVAAAFVKRGCQPDTVRLRGTVPSRCCVRAPAAGLVYSLGRDRNEHKSIPDLSVSIAGPP
jgi:hypothetical protein